MPRWQKGGHISLLSLLVSWRLAASTTLRSCTVSAARSHTGAHLPARLGPLWWHANHRVPLWRQPSQTHTRAACSVDAGKATRVWVSHDSRQGRSLLANMGKKSCSFCEAGCRTDFQLCCDVLEGLLSSTALVFISADGWGSNLFHWES